MQLENVTGVRYMYHDPCHSPMKKHDALTVVNTLMNSAQQWCHRKERSLLRRIGHAGHHAAGHFHAGALSQGTGSAYRRRSNPRRRPCGRGQDTDLLPVLPTGTEALQRRRGTRRGLHRGRNRQALARPRLAAHLRAQRQRRWHRTRAGLKPRSR